MVRLDAIGSLTDFQRNAREHVRRLKETGEPQVLTINGRAELVVQDAAAYQRLLDALDLAESVGTIRKRLGKAAEGDEGVPLERFDRSMRRKHKIGRPRKGGGAT